MKRLLSNYITGVVTGCIVSRFKSPIVASAITVYNYQQIIITLVATNIGIHPNVIFLILLFL
jgi:hypothetical protein